MRSNLYAIYDTIADIFNKPFVEHNDNSAIRAFKDAMLKGDAHKEDFVLYHIGEWNDANGVIEPAAAPLKVYSGLDIKEEKLKAV